LQPQTQDRGALLLSVAARQECDSQQSDADNKDCEKAIPRQQFYAESLASCITVVIKQEG
jgi:hypothetical protein